MKILLRILSGAVTAVLAIALAGTVLLALAGRRAPDRIPTVFDYKVLTVLSGSMEPAIRTGDAIIVEPLRPEHEIREGDVITFRAADAPDMLITHRVIGIVSVNGEPAAYVTKGDANEAPDLVPVQRSQIVGIHRWRIPYYGYLSDFMHTREGIISLVIVPGVLLIALEVRKIFQVIAEEEKARQADEKPADAQSPS
ncbi:signal peptidase I [Symbiobacterium thermophilum]|uniref:Signal peptidase I n=2 Tax=Symbiobacterium thermophilum TaxID=2734 RepID=Q67Q78_SYMTH|nr:signal peptidase I [Symbiobacterium thermophilum]MBY6275370.1 signal peptidase I [Symbiobacterium thermophilum]OTA41977.1 MAG: hypothetical protein A6D92_02440 [Symbiobacterium thermophilum]BAD40165.1 signal peptidase, type I [Symbiobacterium thermophilum IAM 14863]